MKVLLAEDSPTMRMLQVHRLERAGVELVVEACNGAEALAEFEAADRDGEPFDLVLSDWNMPEMDGLALLRAIRGSGFDTPVILATTESERSRVVEAIRAGVTDYVLKPIDAEVLATKIRAHWAALV